MSFWSHLKHAFEHIGHDIAKVGEGFAHAVEGVGKTLVHDVEAVAKQTLAMTNDLIHLRIQQALHDAVNVGETAFKGLRDMNTAVLDVGEKTLENAHLSKGLDKALHKVDQARNFVNDIEDRTVKSIGDSVNGVTDGTIAAGKAAAHGHLGAAFADAASAGASALQVASDLTPEGLAASAAVATLQKTHLGGTVVDSMVEGALTGGRSGLKDAVKLAAKEGAKAEVGVQTQNALDKVTNGNGSTVLGLTAGGAGAAAELYASRKGRHTTESEPARYESRHNTVDEEHNAPGRKGKKKHDAEVDSGQGNGKNGNTVNSNGNGTSQPANGTDPQSQLLEMQQAQRNSSMQSVLNSMKNDDDDDDGDDVTSKAPVTAPQSSSSGSASATASTNASSSSSSAHASTHASTRKAA